MCELATGADMNREKDKPRAMKKSKQRKVVKKRFNNAFTPPKSWTA